jgi:CRISPR system Cascade subunit CasC
MKLELHLLQNFAPSNLNRDDTGAPKDCELGGYRRARISSQCQKRAVRELFRLDRLLNLDDLGARTKRIGREVARALVQDHGHAEDQAIGVALAALEGAGLGRKKAQGEEGWKTEYLLFVPRRAISELAKLLHDNWAELQPLASLSEDSGGDSAEGAPGKKRSKKQAKKDAQAAYPNEVGKQLQAVLEDARGAADLALFGRMIADKPECNVEASCQVAHAISTNRVQMDFDFFTAVDDFKPEDTAGSDMMGTVQFNSSCFYRYVVLDVGALRDNLGDGADGLLDRSVEAFVRAFVSAIPTGKQNSMAAHNFPSYVLAIVRENGQPISLANAFLKPARPRGGGDAERDLVDDSIAKLEDYLHRMDDALGGGGRFMASWADRDLPDKDGIVRAEKLGEFFRDISTRALGAAT